MKKYCIALTGSVATGKSTVAKMLRGMGYEVFDADVLARQVVEPNRPLLQKIAQRFGSKILSLEGKLNRPGLRAIILEDDLAKIDLEALIHPAIEQELLIEVQESGIADQPRVFFYEAALIHERNRAHEFRAVWCTVCSAELQIQRLIQRNEPKITEVEAKALVASQLSAEEKGRRSCQIIETNGSLETIRDCLKTLITEL
ncbi:MAG: dephospho-CoA kinase [Proteobacteria bacterium]|nr:dephospho-CoA kinase [Pseudomonadota bacterium]